MYEVRREASGWHWGQRQVYFSLPSTQKMWLIGVSASPCFSLQSEFVSSTPFFLYEKLITAKGNELRPITCHNDDTVLFFAFIDLKYGLLYVWTILAHCIHIDLWRRYNKSFHTLWRDGHNGWYLYKFTAPAPLFPSSGTYTHTSIALLLNRVHPDSVTLSCNLHVYYMHQHQHHQLIYWPGIWLTHRAAHTHL